MDDLLEELGSFDRPTSGERERRRRFVATAAICGLAFVGLGQLTTGAIFDSTATASVSYATGDVVILTNGVATATLTASTKMAPGDVTYRPITVTNTGSLDLRYAVTGITSAQTKALSTQLKYTIYQGVTAPQCTAGTVGGGTAVVTDATIGTTTAPLIGTTAPGQQSNERPIAAGGPADVLCVAIGLPIATTSTYAKATATVLLTFVGEQTRNN
jgi:spore coat-associated protein N